MITCPPRESKPAISAEPVSVGLAIIAAVETVSGVVIASTAAFAIGSTVLALGTSFVISAASAILQKSLSKSSSAVGSSAAGLNSAVAEQRLSSRQGFTDRELVVGSVLKAGSVFFSQIRGPYYYVGLVLAAHQTDGIDEFRIGTKVVPLDSSGNPVQAPFLAGGIQYLKVSFRGGSDTQELDPILAADFPTLDRSFRQRGLTTVVVKMYFGTDQTTHDTVWGQGDPQILVRLRGAKVYDPRDPSQVLADPTTWKYSRNAVLTFAWWLTHTDGGRVNWSEINIPYLMRAADVCDRKVARADGTLESSYTTDGVITSSADPASAFQDFLTTMLGEMTTIDGQYAFIAGGRRDPERTITEFSSRGALDASAGPPWRDKINTVRTSFIAADRAYQVATGPVYTNPYYYAQDGSEKSVTISLPFVTSYTHVMRIAKHLIERSRLGMRITRGEDVEALRFVPTDILTVEYISGLSILNANYEVVKHGESARPDEFTLDLLQWDNDLLWGWNPAVDQMPWETLAEAA